MVMVAIIRVNVELNNTSELSGETYFADTLSTYLSSAYVQQSSPTSITSMYTKT